MKKIRLNNKKPPDNFFITNPFKNVLSGLLVAVGEKYFAALYLRSQ
jgi:hypothetical protein